MNEVNEFCGIDVSKDTLDAAVPELGHRVFENNKNGFKKLLKWSGKNVHYVMEATGVYQEQLAHFLYSKGAAVSVVNAMSIKRFSQMLLRSVKTDKADAQMILNYAKHNSQYLELWEPLPEYINSCKDISGMVNLMIKQRTALKNKRHSLKVKGRTRAKLLRSLDKSIKALNVQIVELENVMEELIIENENELFDQLKSIPGVGPKTALFLIVITNGFKSFESSKQVSSYLGMAPSIRRSGSSIRGQSRITKSGNSQMRHLLFMSSFTACKNNPACKALFDRITAKGKSKKLALIAVGNKLIKQAFALAKSGEHFNPEYVSVRRSVC